jgi:hypothetical protein
MSRKKLPKVKDMRLGAWYKSYQDHAFPYSVRQMTITSQVTVTSDYEF